MDELGWFRTPDTRLGFLSSQALRAVRVVVDIGLHLGRRVPAGLPGTGEPWTFDTAVASLRACRRPDRGVRPQRGAALLVVAGAGDVLQAGRAVLAGRSGRRPGRGRGILRPARLARPRPGPRPARSRPPRAGARRALSRAAPGPPSTAAGRRSTSTRPKSYRRRRRTLPAPGSAVRPIAVTATATAGHGTRTLGSHTPAAGITRVAADVHTCRSESRRVSVSKHDRSMVGGRYPARCPCTT